MNYRRRRSKPRYVYNNGLPGSAAPPRRIPGKRRSVAGAMLCFALAALMAGGWVFLRDLSTQIAVSDACDLVTKAVGKAVYDIVSEGNYDFDYFVSIDKNTNGEVVAINSNMARINAFSSEILDKVVNSTESGALTVKVPLGNLTGVNLLMGRGPEVPLKIIYLTSSKVDYRNELASAGINQTKHQLDLEVTVDIDVLIPWNTKSTQVVTEILIADTVIVGQVPQTYLNVE